MLKADRDRLVGEAESLGKPSPAVLTRPDVPEPTYDLNFLFKTEVVGEKVKRQMKDKKMKSEHR
ncbi:hypothetical protein FRC08_006886 [Ceratobasidium sp. 394]|nr:hypothetical protein FRC08_006886 [Ceratobasidium sp. 394]KAG9100097.1 hypothetical protein FS749_016287 [Ceratobasidium sp. UAMH 11750]